MGFFRVILVLLLIALGGVMSRRLAAPSPAGERPATRALHVARGG